jgi:Fe2+ or Zn2+ uptake regulation protein
LAADNEDKQLRRCCKPQCYIITLRSRNHQIGAEQLLPKALTQNDRIVLTTLDAEKRPLSAYAILDRTRSSSIRAPTQVYRSLQRLEDQGLVHRIEALSAFVACSEGA